MNTGSSTNSAMVSRNVFAAEAVDWCVLSSPGSSVSPEVAEPKGKRAKGKQANRKDGGKGLSEKEKRRNEMLDHVRRKFPNMLRQPCIVPPIRILDKLKCNRLEKRSVHQHEVTKQVGIQDAALLGYQTEDTVTRYLARNISNLKEPVLFLSNYHYDDYLFFMRHRVKGQSNTSATNTKDSRKRQSSKCTTDTSPEVIGGSENAVVKADANSGFDNATRKSTRSQDASLGSKSSQEAISYSENASRQTDCSQEASDGCADALRKIYTAASAAGATTTTTTTTTPASEASPAAARLFPTPDDGDSKQIRGDFDALIVLPKFGFIVVEAKTLLGEAQPPQGGNTADDDSAAAREAQDEIFRGKIKKALQYQLQKAENVLLHLTSDLVKDPPVTKIMAFPNTSVGDLRRLLEDGDLLEECGKTLGTRTLEEALSRCITSEHILADCMAREISDECQSPGMQWLQTLIRDIADSRQREVSCIAGVSADDSGEVEGEIRAAFPPEVFEEIVARFCGPYSRVQTRTVSDCVHLTGVLYGRSVLREDQLKILESSQTLLFVMGPPGSGKTLLLGLKAAEWASQGDQVVVVCNKGVNYGSLVSWTLYDRVKAYIQSVKLRDIRKKARAAEVEEEGGSGRDDDGGGVSCGRRSSSGVASKNAEKKINPPRKQNNKYRCPGKLKGRVKRSSSSGCPESPDKTSAELGTRPDRNSSEDGGRQHEQLLSGGAAEPQSPSDHHATRPHDNLRPEDIPVDNVHRAYIESDTNVEEFASELLEKYGQGNLRIILDECPKMLDESYIPDTLAEARGPLNKMAGAYEKMITTFTRRVERYKNSASSQERPRGEPREDRSHRCEEGKAESRTTTGEGATSVDRAVNETGLNLKPSFRKHKDVDHNRDKSQHGQRTADRPRAGEERSEEQSTTTEKGVSDNHAENSTDLQPALEANERAVPVEVENSAPEPVSSPAKEFKADEYIATMAERMEKLRGRFQQVSAKLAGLNDEWSRMVADIFETYEDVKSLSERAAGLARGSPERCTAEDVDELENLSTLMVNVMSLVFGVFCAPDATKCYQFLSAVSEARVGSAAPLPPRRGENVPREAVTSGVEAASEAEDTVSPVDESVPRVAGTAVSQLEGPAVQQAEEGPSAPRALSVWAASTYQGYIPPGFHSVSLAECLRCTPNVQKILKWTESEVSPNYKYITSACDVNPPLFTDGFPVKWFDHAPHSSSYKKVNDCRECGEALVKYLVDDLGVLTKAEHEALETPRGQRGKKKHHEDSPLYFHDVMICGSPIHQDVCAFIQSLQERGISVLYEHQKLKHPPPYTDNVLVIGRSTAQGLEAKIVVFVPELERVTDEEKAALESSNSSTVEDEEEQKYSEDDRIQRYYLKRLGHWNREYLRLAASRCLSLLIIFH